ncbi:hypothetical protein M8J76_004424 [Diaphorina citri]|nr:hypothetical protein M8J75_004187 [Diaphorina citri]KAI5749070.1 hypothetical protein M8J76_004424 [Diaphorina citri]
MLSIIMLGTSNVSDTCRAAVFTSLQHYPCYCVINSQLSDYLLLEVRAVSHQLSETPCIVTFDTPCITFYGSDARGFQPISCWNGRWVWKLGRKDAATRYLVIPRNIRISHR